MRRNIFQEPIPEIKELLKDPIVEGVVRNVLAYLLSYLGFGAGQLSEVIEKTLEYANNYRNLDDYETSTHQMLTIEGITSAIPKKFNERAEIVFNQIKNFLQGGKILDIGCGDGRISHYIAQNTGKTVCLVDVYKHANLDNLPYEFKEQVPGQPILYDDKEFDTSLLLTVLHHTDDPEFLLKEAIRLTKPGGVIIIIESVYGIDRSKIAGFDKDNRRRVEPFLRLDAERHRLVNIFTDHFYNRCLHYHAFPEMKVNVPYNFNTPLGWEKFFKQLGLEQKTFVHLGIDQPIVPEYHTLHVVTYV